MLQHPPVSVSPVLSLYHYAKLFHGRETLVLNVTNSKHGSVLSVKEIFFPYKSQVFCLLLDTMFLRLFQMSFNGLAIVCLEDMAY